MSMQRFLLYLCHMLQIISQLEAKAKAQVQIL